MIFKKFIILLLIFVITIPKIYAQTTERFVKLYADTPILLTMRNIIETDSNYILAGNSYNPNNQYHSEITILWFDKYGNYKNIKTFGDTTYFFNPNTPYGNTLHKDNKGNYYIFYLKTNWDYSEYYNYVLKFNPQFDSIWLHQTYSGSMGVEDTSVFRLTNGIIDSLGNIYIIGGTSVTENGDTIYSHASLYVEKLDSSGNQLWLHTYEIGHSYGDNAVIDPVTNNLWIGGVSETRPGVYEISPDGQLLWFHTFEVPFWIDTDPVFICALPDSEGSIFVSGDQLWNQGVRMAFSSIIQNNQIIKDWYYAPDFSDMSNIGSSTSCNTVMLDSGIITILLQSWDIHQADTMIPFNTKFKQVYKFDLNGNVLWKRNFYIPIIDTPGTAHNIYDFITTSDGGFAAAGWAIDTNNVYKAILAKFDSLGCNGYHSCADTAMLLELLSPIDTVCSGDTLWMNFHIDGLSAPYKFTTSEEDTIYPVYYSKDSIYLYAYNWANGLSAEDSTQYISYDIYIQYPFVAENTISDTTIQLAVKLQDAYGRTKTATYNIFIKDCSVNIAKQNKLFLAVYPNPACSKEITIETNINETAFLSLYNSNGKSLQTMRLKQGKHIYKIKQNLSPGIYYVSIWNNYGSSVKKLIVR